MSVTVSSVTTQISSGLNTTSISLTTPSASVGDLLFIILGNDWSTMSGLTLTSIVPSATSTALTGFSADGGTNQPHIKAWWAPVTTGGAVTVTADTGFVQEEKFLAVYILSGADTSSPIDGVSTSSLTNAADAVTPSISPTTSTALLICHAQADGSNSAGTLTYSTPGTMTNKYDLVDTGNFSHALGAIEQLSASGATGTRTFTRTSGATVPWWVASSVGIKATSGTADNQLAWIRA